MSKFVVAVTRHLEGADAVRQAIELSGALVGAKARSRVLLKPNIVTWTDQTTFPKWGVITTSAVVERVVVALKDLGVGEITIGEGIGPPGPRAEGLGRHAFETLGYVELGKRYGVRCVNFFEGPFEKVEVLDGVSLKVSADLLASDFVVNVPVLKTHSQVGVSLGLKNLKGALDLSSRKKCHSLEPGQDLDTLLARLFRALPPMATVIDGIYSLEAGPGPDGMARRSNLIIASADPLSADLVGARALGQDPAEIGYLAAAAQHASRPVDLSDVSVVGETLDSVARPHKWRQEYNAAGSLPAKLEKMGVQGLTFRAYDKSVCTYCTTLVGALQAAVTMAWKNEPWEGVEILTGKVAQPMPGMKKTLLFGQCMCNLHKENPAIAEALCVPGCPPDMERASEALAKAGIDADPNIFRNLEAGMKFLAVKYRGRKEFQESFYCVP